MSSHFERLLEDARWEHLLGASADALDRLAAEVDDAIAKGDVATLDPDEL